MSPRGGTGSLPICAHRTRSPGDRMSRATLRWALSCFVASSTPRFRPRRHRGVRSMPATRRPLVAVFGSSTLPEGDPDYAEVVRLGAELAARDLAVMTGGYDGAMAAASR